MVDSQHVVPRMAPHPSHRTFPGTEQDYMHSESSRAWGMGDTEVEHVLTPMSLSPVGDRSLQMDGAYTKVYIIYAYFNV